MKKEINTIEKNNKILNGQFFTITSYDTVCNDTQYEYFIDGGGELYIFKNQEYVGKLKVTHKGGVSKNLYSDLNYIFGIK